MQLPKGQTVIENMLGWERGPLPTPELERIAWQLFTYRYPAVDYDSSLFSDERNDCRRLTLRLRSAFLKMDRWTIENASEKLADQVAQLVFGDRRLGKTIREEVREYADTYIADAWGHFGRRLMYEKDVKANDAEIAQEDMVNGR
ncbi:MAG TPA: hypothetical protein VEJ63_00745 [Planctomycetota bacterium]|nr:hypothetical protein [Planctomycetota bacterium]